MTLYKQLVGTGAVLSPLDLILTAVDASADWSTKYTEIDATDGYLKTLWIEATNTSNSDRTALMLTFTRNVGVTTRACEYITLGQLPDDQINVNPYTTSYTEDYIRKRGAYRGLLQDVVIIDRDYIYISWAGQSNIIDDQSISRPYVLGCFLSVVEKAHTFDKGIISLDSYRKGVFYKDTWYGASVVTDINNRQCRVNATYSERFYRNMGNTDAYFYTSTSIHVNLSTLVDNAEMILLGYIPGATFGIYDHHKTNYGLNVTLKEGEYVGYPSFYAEGLNTFLFPE